MPKSHRPYATEFRRQMVDLVRSGRTPEELSRELRCSDECGRSMVSRAAPSGASRVDAELRAEVGQSARSGLLG